MKNSINTGNSNSKNENLKKIEETSISVYLDIIQNEYDIERQKKYSFETRTGFILSLLGAMYIFLLDKLSFKSIYPFFSKCLTLYSFFKIISFSSIYIGIFVMLYLSFKIIDIKFHENFNIDEITSTSLYESPLREIPKIIFNYRKVVKSHRDLNKSRAENFKKCIQALFFTFISMIIYTII